MKHQSEFQAKTNHNPLVLNDNRKIKSSFPEIKTQLKMIDEKKMPELSEALNKIEKVFEKNPKKKALA